MSEQTSEKSFPLCGTGRKIPWSVAERAYEGYVKRYGRCQTLERLGERGGFYVEEMDGLYPGWREEVEEIYLLRAEVGRLLQLSLSTQKHADELLSKLHAVEKERGRYKAVLEQIADADAAWSGIGCTMLASEALGVKESV